MGKIIRHKKIILFLVVVMLGISSPVLALLVDWPPSPMPPEFREIHGESELHEMIAYIYEWAIALGGIAVFVVLIIAGVQYLTSAGRPEAMRSARDRIQNAVIGIILLLSIWLILNTINPALTTLQPLELNMAEFLSCEIEDGGPCANHDECRGAAEFNSQHAECEKTPPDPVGTCILDQCKTRFGEYYYCENERCVLDEDAWLAGFRPRQCASVTIWPQGGIDEEGDPTGDPRRWESKLMPGDRYRISSNQYLNKSGEGFFAVIEFPVNPNKIDPITGMPELYDNCVAHIELYKGRSLVEKCVSDRERVQITATRHPDDNGAHPCGGQPEGYCHDTFGGEYFCENDICSIIQFHRPDQLYDEWVRCIEYREVRMPF